VTERTACGLFALLVLAYITVFVWFSPLTLQDYPNHLARAYVIAALREHWSGVRFGIYAALIVFTYLTHLAAIAFIAAALGVSAVWRIVLKNRALTARSIFSYPSSVCLPGTSSWRCHIGSLAISLPSKTIGVRSRRR
jgi:hypothetical protein